MIYGKTRHYGHTWYCQRAGKEWATDPAVGLRLEWRTRSRVEPGSQTGWHLWGPDHDGEWLGRSFSDAIDQVWRLTS